MMKWLTVFILTIVAIIVVGSSAYTIREGEQVVITQFGKPVGDPIKDAGLKFKMPFIQDVRRFEKRILKWDGDPNQIPTEDKKFVMLDTTARWRINDPLLFLTKVRDMQGAYTRLDDILDADTRDAISRHFLVEAVRSSNRQMAEEVDVDVMPESTDSEKPGTTEEGKTESSSSTLADRAGTEKIKVGRRKISEMILKMASEEVAVLGIELVDFRIKKINYVEQVRQKVYDRMISERMKIAERYRSEGLGRKSEIDGQREKELLEIESEAYRKAETIKGEAEAESTRLYAEAYSTDPEFYEFLETLTAYKTTLDEDTMLILSTDSPFFKYIQKGSVGQKPGK